MADLIADWDDVSAEAEENKLHRQDKEHSSTHDEDFGRKARHHEFTEDLSGSGRIGGTLRELSKLIRTNFTRDVVLVIDISTSVGAPRMKYLPGRAKVDTGCEESLVAYDFLRRADITPEQ